MSEILNKEIIIVAGANGVGKTTFARQFLNEYPDYEYLNADEIAKEISPENIQEKQIKAGKIFFEKLKSFVAEEKSFLIESTLSGRYLIKFLSGVQKRNYQTTIIFIFVDSPEVAIERIAGRVKKGGHFVPEKDVRRRFERGRRNFWKIYKNLADRWNLIYNSDNSFEYVVIGKQDQDSILNDFLFEKFLQDL